MLSPLRPSVTQVYHTKTVEVRIMKLGCSTKAKKISIKHNKLRKMCQQQSSVKRYREWMVAVVLVTFLSDGVNICIQRDDITTFSLINDENNPWQTGQRWRLQLSVMISFHCWCESGHKVWYSEWLSISTAQQSRRLKVVTVPIASCGLRGVE